MDRHALLFLYPPSYLSVQLSLRPSSPVVYHPVKRHPLCTRGLSSVLVDLAAWPWCFILSVTAILNLSPFRVVTACPSPRVSMASILYRLAATTGDRATRDLSFPSRSLPLKDGFMRIPLGTVGLVMWEDFAAEHSRSIASSSSKSQGREHRALREFSPL